MKYLFVLLAVVAVASAALSDEEKAKFREYYDQCVAESHVDKELIAKARHAEFTGNDDKLNKYFLCMFKHAKFIKDNGELDSDLMIEKMPNHINHEEGVTTFKACIKKTEGVEKNLIPKTFLYCVYKHFPKMQVF